MLDQVGNVFKGVIASVAVSASLSRLDELFIDEQCTFPHWI